MAKSAQSLEARRLRKRGASIIVIAKKVGVSKGSVSLWCRDIQLTAKQKERLVTHAIANGLKGRLIGAMANKKERIERQKRFMEKGQRLVGLLSKREFFLAGAALYWAEGSKKTRDVVFINSDPIMIKLFIRWLKECLQIEKDRIYCRVGINEAHKRRVDEVERYWSKVTGVARDRFARMSLKKVKNKKVYEKINGQNGKKKK